ICQAVASAHAKGVIHRDLKPGNILIDSENQPHILDFGLAKPAGPNATVPLTLTTQFMGTIAYSSPEQTRGDQSQIDSRSDVYALGVILYEMVTRRLPYVLTGGFVQAANAICTYPADPPSGFNPEVTFDLDTIILRALCKDPQRRYQTVYDFGEDVRRFLVGEPIAARRDSIIYLAQMKARGGIARHKWLARIMIALWIAMLFKFVSQPLDRLWPGPEHAYERWLQGIAAQTSGNALNRIQIIGITPRTWANMETIAAANLVAGVSSEWRGSLRKLHGLLMSRLAVAGARVVVWDIAFPELKPEDVNARNPPATSEIQDWSEAFAAGARAVNDAGGVVVVNVWDWPSDPQITPDTDPAILAAPVRWGGPTLGVSPFVDWQSDLIVVRNATTNIFSLPLAAFAAMRHPHMAVRAQLDPQLSQLMLVYSDPRQSLQQTTAADTDIIQLSTIQSPEADGLQLGMRPADRVGRLVVQLPSDADIRNATMSYDDVLALSPEALLKRFNDTMVIIGDFRDQNDVHPTPDGRMLHGAYGHAAAISTLLYGRSTMYFPSDFTWFLLLFTGSSMGIIISHRVFRTFLIGVCIALFCAFALFLASLVTFYSTRIIWNPMLPVAAMLFSAWLTYKFVPSKSISAQYDS
ncbi:MAG TPA: CHASE2 domain-containing protein, partial [Phycisphaerales bacterium]|nr:CHASE2 domain-containing protein [Phycisphaerales bacterium]